MKSKRLVLTILIAIAAMSVAVTTVLAGQRSFGTTISGELFTPEELVQFVGANQRLTKFDGRPFILNLKEDILSPLSESPFAGKPACTKEEGADQRSNPITGVVQMTKDNKTGLYWFLFKWDESTKKLASDGYTGKFVEVAPGTFTVTFGDEFGGDSFTLKALLVGTHPKSGKDYCYWYPIWHGVLTFTVTLAEIE